VVQYQRPNGPAAGDGIGEEFRKVPGEWKQEAVARGRTFAGQANGPLRSTGAEEEETLGPRSTRKPFARVAPFLGRAHPRGPTAPAASGLRWLGGVCRRRRLKKGYEAEEQVRPRLAELG